MKPIKDQKLFQLFLRLRNAGMPLGIEDYQLIIQALNADFIVSKEEEEKETIMRLCHVIWLKSEDQKQLFNYHFQQVYSKTNSSNSEFPNSEYFSYRLNSQKVSWKQQLVRLTIILGSTCLLVIAVLISIRAFRIRRSPSTNPLPPVSSRSSSEGFLMEQIPESRKPELPFDPQDPRDMPPFPLSLPNPPTIQDYFDEYPKRKEFIIYALKIFQDLEFNSRQYEKLDLPNIDFVEKEDISNNSPRVSINKERLEKLGKKPDYLEKIVKEGIPPDDVPKVFTPEELTKIESLGLDEEKIKQEGIPAHIVEKMMPSLTSDELSPLGNSNLDQLYRYGYLLAVIDCGNNILKSTEKSEQFRGFLRKDKYKCLPSSSTKKTKSLPSEDALKDTFSDFLLAFDQKQIQQLGISQDDLSTILNGILEELKPKDLKRLSKETEQIVVIFLILLTLGIRCIPIPVQRQLRVDSQDQSKPDHDTTALPPFTRHGSKSNISNQQEEQAFFGSYFLPIDRCLPMTQRQMQQIWRKLHLRVREGQSTELDVSKTVQQIGRNGLLLEPVFLPKQVNRTELLLLIDYGGSMIPFHLAIRQLVNALFQAGRLSGLNIYYFKNCPCPEKDCLYPNSLFEEEEGEVLDKVLNSLHPTRAVVLILSDAGSARGGFRQDRVDATELFLDRLRKQVRRIAWLNPEPKTRWTKTTAEAIAHQVPMFEFDLQGLKNAINFLQGQSQSVGGGYR